VERDPGDSASAASRDVPQKKKGRSLSSHELDATKKEKRSRPISITLRFMKQEALRPREKKKKGGRESEVSLFAAAGERGKN